jgi:hypothetical protein
VKLERKRFYILIRTHSSPRIHARQGDRFSTSVGGTLTGRRCDLLILDGPVNVEDTKVSSRPLSKTAARSAKGAYDRSR